MHVSILNTRLSFKRCLQYDMDREKADSFVIPDAEKWLITSNESHVLVQERMVGDFYLIIFSGETSEDIEIQYSFGTGGFLFNFLPKAASMSGLDDNEDFTRERGRYSIAQSVAGNGVCKFTTRSDVQIQLYIKAESFLDLRISYPRIVDFLFGVSKEGNLLGILGGYPIDTELLGCLRRIITCKFTGSLADKYFGIRIEELLFDFNKQLIVFNAPVDPAGSITDMKLLYEVMLFIDRNIKHSLHLGSIMKEFHLSEYKAKKIFLDVDKTFSEYLTVYRMKKAMVLLMHTNKKISAIAMDVGYYSASKFSHAFQKCYGIYPGKVRRNL